jgi:hypothetical protein
MPSYRRPLSYITDAVLDAGFLIDRILEARPTLEYMRADPEGYDKASKRPSFICIRAVSTSMHPALPLSWDGVLLATDENHEMRDETALRDLL